jgi:hypothetical protein
MPQGSIIRAGAIAGVTSAVLAIGALAGFVVVVGADPIADAGRPPRMDRRPDPGLHPRRVATTPTSGSQS